ncbi:hypothetical protein F5148DRAFT_1162029 [Russula earlei]|uniref:Uncharacterized protein n=1 Tax=Russula earlei TaxID=71964 RepID=A0ACC0ULX9_9AGAM|nr:hypothetical protein F5148DRAFT_1162029 [Russula earlei]
MRTSPVFVIFCLAVGIAPSFALPLEVRSPDPVLHTRGLLYSSLKKDQTESPSPKKGQTATVGRDDSGQLPLSKKQEKKYHGSGIRDTNVRFAEIGFR